MAASRRSAVYANCLESRHLKGRKGERICEEKVNYIDDRGEMPEKLFVVSEDILPSPAEFARALEREKVTINLSAGSLNKFRRVAKKHRMPYQALIREVLDRVATRIE